MYYCYIKKLLLFLMILLFTNSHIYASFPIEDFNEKTINTVLSQDNNDDEPPLSGYILRGVLFFLILLPGLYFLIRSWFRACKNQVRWVRILSYVIIVIFALILLLSIFFGIVGFYNPGG